MYKDINYTKSTTSNSILCNNKFIVEQQYLKHTSLIKACHMLKVKSALAQQTSKLNIAVVRGNLH